MNWDDLRLFLTVSRTAKLDQAAAILRQDPTTISRRIRRLEKDLGQTLFERTRRGHILTEQGQALSGRLEDMESIALGIETDAGHEHAVSGKIRLGVSEGLGTFFVAPALAKFTSAWSGVQVDLISLSGFVSVPKREADMSILLTRPKSGRLKVRKLTDYSLHLYGSRDYLSACPDIRSVDDLGSHTLIGYVDDLIYSPQLRYFEDILPGLAPRICSPSIVAQYELTRSGAGLCILPKFIAHKCENLVPVLTDTIKVERSFWLVTHEDVSEFIRIQRLNDFLVSEVGASQAVFQ